MCFCFRVVVVVVRNNKTMMMLLVSSSLSSNFRRLTRIHDQKIQDIPSIIKRYQHLSRSPIIFIDDGDDDLDVGRSRKN